jgi:uncharacterized protein DUF4384
MRRLLGMGRAGIRAAALAAFLAASAFPAGAAEQVPIARTARPRLDVDVWINKDEGGIFRPGESMRVYFRASADAYLLVYNIDTEGYIHLIYPYAPDDPAYVDAGRTYQIPSRRDPYDLVADGPAGVEYVVAVASPTPFRDLPWYLSADRAARGRAPDDSESEDDTDADYIVGDPYVGIDQINRRICPEGREADLATSETYFYIERRVDYPRYVCADCHFGSPYFDPFISTCTVVDIRIDATWARYAPIRLGTVRPRYYYRIRPEAPTRYRAWKNQWSSLDGRVTLRNRFAPGGETQVRPGKGPRRFTPPEFRDLRRERTSRFWQGRDQILRLRERRLEDNRARQEEARRRGEIERRREPSQRRDNGEPPRRGEPPARDRERTREKAEPPKDRPQAGERERGRPSDRGESRPKSEARDREERRGRDEGKQRDRERQDANQDERGHGR